MATLYKRGDIYWTRFFDADGKRQARTTGKTEKREAAKEAQRLEVESRNGSGRGSELPKAFAVIIETAAREAASGELTLARAEDLVLRLHRLANPDFKIVSLFDHLSQWVTSQTGVTESTAGVYEDTRRHIVAAVGPKVAAAAVGDFTTKQAVTALQKLKDDGLKSSTVNMDLRALRRALHAAVKQGLAKTNVAADIKPFAEDDSDEVAPFTATEVRAMIDHAKTSDEWKGMIILGAHTGLRLSDVAKLTRAHIDGTKLVIRPKKTTAKKKTITIPLSPPALGWIGDREGPLFPTLCKRVPGTLSTTFRRIMKSSGVPRHITEAGDVVKRRSFHSLRHSFASWMAEADIHSDVRQKLTGHSSAGIHARYTHHDEALDRAVGTLPSL
jgi:integrase